MMCDHVLWPNDYQGDVSNLKLNQVLKNNI